MEKRSESKTRISNWAATFDLESTHKPDLTEIVDSILFREDDSDSSTATSSPHDIDFDGVDYHEVTLNYVAVSITFSNISQGEVKWLKVIEGTGDDHSFSGVTLVSLLTANELTLPIIYQVFNKDSTTYVVPMNQISTYDAATDVQAKALTSDTVFLTPGNLGAVTDNLVTTVVNIGDWNMDTTTNVNVAHGLTLTSIRSITGMIRNDADNIYYRIPTVIPTSGNVDCAITIVGSTNVTLERRASGIFDSSSYNSTSYNRGYLVIQYEV